MAGVKSGNDLDKWRNYFRACDSDIFDLIENAIKVGALDFPQEFKSKRDKIAEILFTSGTKCAGCASAELRVSTEEEKVEEVRSEFVGDGKVDCGGDDQKAEANVNKVESSIRYRDSEALIVEIGKEDQIFDEVMRIKKILDNSKREADYLVLDSLQRLEEIPMHLDLLKTTKIGKSVNTLRKHASADIRKFSRMLVELWKHMVDDSLVCETKTPKGGFEGVTQDSVNPSAIDEAGLPTPPLEDLSFLIAYDKSMQICNLFDGLADYLSEQMQQLPADQSVTHPKPIQPTILESGSGRSVEPGSEKKAGLDKKLLNKPKFPSERRSPVLLGQNEARCSDHAAEPKLERTTKKKLKEGYQQAEKARRERTIQIEELHDLPKQGSQGFGGRNSLEPCNTMEAGTGYGQMGVASFLTY